ncbi:MAG: hypothetical protein ACKO4L_00955 [Nodosilinea sp.]
MTLPLLPTLDLIPLHGAIVAQQPLTLDVLVRITPPPVSLAADRLPLNLRGCLKSQRESQTIPME